GKIDLDFRSLNPDRVTGVSLAELGDGADVAGMELGNLNGFAALHNAEMGEFFGTAAGVIFKSRVIADDAADDFEEAYAAGERIGHRFEDEYRRRLLVVHFAC